MNKEELLISYQRAYYFGTPVVTDLEYDRLYNEVEASNPNCVAVTKVGGDSTNSFEKVEHTVPMLSLDKVYTTEELLKFHTKIKYGVIGEPKIDGISIIIYYKEGILYKAVTRGNGLTGDDVTNNVLTIEDVPKILSRPIDIAVRGEIYLPKSELTRINKISEVKYANCRNLTAGVMRHKHASKVKGIGLSIFVYEGYYKDNPGTHEETLFELTKLNFKVNYFQCIHSETSLSAFINKFTQIRDSLDYDIDGLVFKANNINERDTLGFTSHHPKWALAYKFEAPQAVSVLESIDVQVGRTGRITPVARIKPTELAGSVISNITLHNQDYINMLGLAIGDTISISKHGDVIPAIDEVLENGGNTTFVMPTICPSCGMKTVKIGAHLFCTNKECDAQVVGNLMFFAGKNQMDIDGLGESTIQFIYDTFGNNAYGTVFDIYDFDYNKLIHRTGFGGRKVRNIQQGLIKSSVQPFSKLLASMGLEGLGHKNSKLITNHFNGVEEIQNATREDFMQIDGIGRLTAKTICDSIKYNTTWEHFLILLRTLDTNYDKSIKSTGGSFCITGTFEIKRKEIEERVDKLGGIVVSSVSKTTDYLICGKNSGSKQAKAEKLGVPILSLKELDNIVTQQET